MDEIKLFRKELLAKVSRMEALEAEFGIRIEHLSLIAEPDSDYVQLNFEVFPLLGNTISQDVQINYAFYDDDGLITFKDSLVIWCEDFKGFSIESRNLYINTMARNITRVVFYPSKY